MSKRLILAVFLPAIVCLWGCPAVQGRCVGPNPRAMAIQYEKISDTVLGTAQVRIKGIIDNHGTSSFLTNAGQQVIQLWEDNTKVAEVGFEDLAVDETAQVQYERTWSTNDEFRPSQYQVVIVYDPDIYMDGNPENDDCNKNDNSFARSTSGLDSIL